MILTCPSCATRYFVEDDAVPAAGRPVRCAACGAEWRAAVEPDAASAGARPAGADAASAPLPKAFRAKAAAKRETRQAVAQGVVWAGLTVAFAGVALAAVLFRTDVVKAFPRANAAYAAVRMPVNPTGLALEGVQGGPGLENGRQMLLVTGQLRNVETGPRAPAALRVSIFDKAGHRAAEQLLRPDGGEIRPGEARAFRAVFYDPPFGAAEFGVDFAWDAQPAPAGKAHAPTHASAGHGAEPHAAPAEAPHAPVAEAAPLPADSPYALPAAAAHAEAAPAHATAAHTAAPAHGHAAAH